MGIFNSGGPAPTCPSNPQPEYDSVPVAGSMTFHQLAIILAGSFAAFGALISALLIILHATHFSKPGEQANIIRLLLIVPVFAGLSCVCIILDGNAVYVKPWMDFYESIAVASLFLLICNYVSPSAAKREAYFNNLEHRVAGSVSPGGSLSWYRRRWIMVFQYVIVSFAVAAITCITQAAGVYCSTSNNIHFAHLWLNIIKILSTIIALLSLLKFTLRLKSDLAHHNIFKKLLTFKLIVFLNAIQTMVFTYASAGITPTTTISYFDISVALPSLILTIEVTLFSILQHFAFDWAPYRINKGGYRAGNAEGGQSAPQRYQGGPLGVIGILKGINPWEVIKGVPNGFSIGSTEHQYESEDTYLRPPPGPYPNQQFNSLPSSDQMYGQRR